MTTSPAAPATSPAAPAPPTADPASPTADPAPGAAVLRRFREPAPPQPERCELCGQAVAERHRHLVETELRSLTCACQACALLFEQSGSGQGRYRAVPDRYLVDPGHRLDDGAWEQLQIPVSTAFFLRNAALERLIALYPSPAGATESELDPQTWEAVLGRSPLAAHLEADVEALLIRRAPGRAECFLVPIDVCYELVGRMRLHWQGFDGGAEARADLEAFFDRVRARARAVREGELP